MVSAPVSTKVTRQGSWLVAWYSTEPLARSTVRSALFDYLSGEPGLSLSTVKEVHFFDDEAQDWASPDYGAYHANFAPFDGRPRGEATPIYAYWPGSLERIGAYNPAMKLILVLR